MCSISTVATSDMARPHKLQKTGHAAPSAPLAIRDEAPGTAAGASGVANLVYPERITLEHVAKGTSVSFLQWAKDIVTYTNHALVKFIAGNTSKCNGIVMTGQNLQAIQPLTISSATSSLQSFREVMRFDNMSASIAGTGLYEAAGTVLMIDPVPRASGGDLPTVPQLDAAMSLWSDQTYFASHQTPHMRRFLFPCAVASTHGNRRRHEKGWKQRRHVYK